jgi:hypothetical protein
MECAIQDIGHLPGECVRALQSLFPLFEEKSFSFDVITGRHDCSIVWFERIHDRRRYSVALGSNGFLRLRRYDSDDTRMTLFESRTQHQEDFDDLSDAFMRSESEWTGYKIEIRPGLWV